MTASSIACTPLFLNDAPQSTGTMNAADRRAADRVTNLVVGQLLAAEVLLDQHLRRATTAASITSWRAFSTASRYSSGTSMTSNFLPQRSRRRRCTACAR